MQSRLPPGRLAPPKMSDANDEDEEFVTPLRGFNRFRQLRITSNLRANNYIPDRNPGNEIFIFPLKKGASYVYDMSSFDPKITLDKIDRSDLYLLFQDIYMVTNNFKKLKKAERGGCMSSPNPENARKFKEEFKPKIEETLRRHQVKFQRWGGILRLQNGSIECIELEVNLSALLPIKRLDFNQDTLKKQDSPSKRYADTMIKSVQFDMNHSERNQYAKPEDHNLTVPSTGRSSDPELLFGDARKIVDKYLDPKEVAARARALPQQEEDAPEDMPVKLEVVESLLIYNSRVKRSYLLSRPDNIPENLPPPISKTEPVRPALSMHEYLQNAKDVQSQNQSFHSV